MQDIQSILQQHKLSNDDYKKILNILNREPNLVEIGIFSAMWSEHCSYKSSKIYLNGFHTKEDWVIQEPGENAGIIDIGGGYGAVFKMESHNHPSFIEPYAGAATGVGGIMRDVFTMGARPVASLNSIRFGDITKNNEIGKKHRYLLKGVVGGISGYGNCMGVPTIGGETTFESCYNGNILVNAFTLGIVKNNEIFYGKAEGVGNPVIYVGSKTGRDGLGGAVMSSDSFNEDSKKLRPAVQVGDPFTEKLLLEACLELFKEDLIVGIQDMGAAGLTSSSFEMAGRSGSGMIIHLDKVPMREEGMNPYELMLSESQERMLICAKKGYENKILEIFKKWELDCAIIGEVTNSGKMELYWHNEKCAEIPVQPLSEKSPILRREVSQNPTYLDKIESFKIDSILDINNGEMLEEILKSPDINSKSWIYEQYDNTIQNNTMTKAGKSGASVIRIKENNKALALSVYCNSRLCYINPKEGAIQAVAKVGRDIALKGGIPLAITDCLNFGNPENSEVMWQFKEACEGIKIASKNLKMPVVSGNVSLYNQTDNIDIYPTPSIAAVGIIDEPSKIIKDHSKDGNSVYILCKNNLELNFGASLVAKLFGNSIKAEISKISLEDELNIWKFLQVSKDKIDSAYDIHKGGLATTLAKLCIFNNVGCICDKKLDKLELFGESPNQILISANKQNTEFLLQIAEKYNLCLREIATLGGNNIQISDINLPLSKAQTLFFDSFKELIEDI